LRPNSIPTALAPPEPALAPDSAVKAAGPRVAEGRVTVRVERDRDGVVLAPVLFSSGVLSARLTPWGLWLVGACAHPIGGDQVCVKLHVGENTTLDVRSTGATVARAGADQSASTTDVVAEVGDHATLRWLVEPGMAVAGATHVAEATVRMSASARLLWRDEVVLGRFAEAPGTWSTGLRVEQMGRALVTTRLGVGPSAPGWGSSAVLDGSRVVVSLVVVDPDGFPSARGPVWVVETGVRGTISCPEGSSFAQVTAWGDTLRACRAVAARLLGQLGCSERQRPLRPRSPLLVGERSEWSTKSSF